MRLFNFDSFVDHIVGILNFGEWVEVTTRSGSLLLFAFRWLIITKYFLRILGPCELLLDAHFAVLLRLLKRIDGLAKFRLRLLACVNFIVALRLFDNNLLVVVNAPLLVFQHIDCRLHLFLSDGDLYLLKLFFGNLNGCGPAIDVNAQK